MTAQSLAVAQSSPTQRLFGVSPTKEGPHHALVERTDRPSTAAGLVRKLAEMAVFGHFAAGLPKNQKKTLSAVSAPLELLPSRQKTSLGPPNCSQSNRGAVNSCRTQKLLKSHFFWFLDCSPKTKICHENVPTEPSSVSLAFASAAPQFVVCLACWWSFAAAGPVLAPAFVSGVSFAASTSKFAYLRTFCQGLFFPV